MNNWLDQIHTCGFSADVLFTKDGDCSIFLHWIADGHRQIKLFQDVDADRVLDEAMTFARNWDAFRNTNAECSK